MIFKVLKERFVFDFVQVVIELRELALLKEYYSILMSIADVAFAVFTDLPSRSSIHVEEPRLLRSI